MLGFVTILMPVGLVVGAAGSDAGAPKTTLAPKSWQLDFDFHDPARITVTLPGESEPTTFWYLLYTVTNQTGREIEFYPAFHLVTDTLAVVEGGDRIHPQVYDAVAARHRRLYPFFVAPPAAYGKLNQGTDNSRTSVAVFRDFDLHASSFAVYVGGLSGEIARVNNPAFEVDKAESDNNVRFFLLRKTLEIRYDLPGDPLSRETVVPTRVKREWVMR
ncbi:MAG TPA: hypothetical protein VM243_20195 [Phycisphaerae bacterium]|nr:hypothetical protein [Phycisphaerae bacterium]